MTLVYLEIECLDIPDNLQNRDKVIDGVDRFLNSFIFQDFRGHEDHLFNYKVVEIDAPCPQSI